MDIREQVERQLGLENEARALGVERYRGQRPLPWRMETGGVAEEAELPPGRQLLKLCVHPVAVAISEFVSRISEGGSGRRPVAATILDLGDPEEIAYLAARVVVNSAAQAQSAQATAFAVTEAIIDHAQMVRLKNVNKAGYKGLVKASEKAGRFAPRVHVPGHTALGQVHATTVIDRVRIISMMARVK